MKTADKKSLTKEAAEKARDEIIKRYEKLGLTEDKTIKRIVEGLDAHEVKATYDKKQKKWVYSKKLVAHDVRLKASEMSLVLRDMKPSAKVDVKHSGDIGIKQLLEEIDGKTLGLPSEREMK